MQEHYLLIIFLWAKYHLLAEVNFKFTFFITSKNVVKSYSVTDRWIYFPRTGKGSLTLLSYIICFRAAEPAYYRKVTNYCKLFSKFRYKWSELCNIRFRIKQGQKTNQFCKNENLHFNKGEVPIYKFLNFIFHRNMTC